MISPTLFQNGTAGVDPALEGRVATAESDIATLKSGKATAASVTAVANRVGVLESVPTALTVRVPEDYATIGAACLAARNARRFSSVMPVIDVAPGTYSENPDVSGCRIVSRSFPAEITPTSYIYGTNAARNYRINFTIPDASGYAVGDLVAIRRTAIASDDEARMAGCAVVTAVAGNVVSVKFSGSSNVAGSAATTRIYRFPIQLRTSQTLEFECGAFHLDGVGIVPQSSPETWGAHDLLSLRNGTVLSLPPGQFATPILRPGLGLGNGRIGARLDRDARILGGRLSLGGCQYENLPLSSRSSVSVLALHSTHSDVNVSLYDGADLTVSSYTSDQATNVVSGATGIGIYAITGSRAAIRDATLRGSAADIGAYVNTLVSITNVTTGTTSPAVNSTANRNAGIWS